MASDYKTHLVIIPKDKKINKNYLFTLCKLPANMQSVTTEKEEVTCQRCLNKMKIIN